MEWKLLCISLCLAVISSVSSTPAVGEKPTAAKTRPVPTTRYGYEMTGNGKYKYRTLAIKRLGQFDFGFANECDCDCRGDGGDLWASELQKRTTALSKRPKDPPKTSADGRPLVTSVSDAMKHLKHEPEEARVRFLYSLMDDIDNEMLLECECCEDWHLMGGEYNSNDKKK